MRMPTKSATRPIAITGLSIFFFFGAAMSIIASASLLFPGSFLESMWRLNPRAHEVFSRMGGWAVVLMCALSAACAAAA